MALFKINRGSKKNLPSQKTEGYMYITEDVGDIYVDISSTERIRLNAESAEKLRKITYNADGSKKSEVFVDYDYILGLASQISTLNTNLANKSVLTINTWEDAISPSTSEQKTSFIINKVKDDTTYEAMEANDLIDPDQIYLVEGPDNKMDKHNPVGTGSFSMNRLDGSTTGPNSTTLGSNCTASGTQSVAEGYQTIATGSFGSHSEGFVTTASGKASHAEGSEAEASGDYSHAEGHNTTASKIGAHAEGHSTTASGNYSHAEGEDTTASGNNAHAEGFSTTASNTSAHAEGVGTIADNTAAHAEGYETKASGWSSHAEGEKSAVTSNNNITATTTNYTTAGFYGHAEGYGTVSYGTASHAEGNGTMALGKASHAGGESTVASGNYSHAEGYNTIAAGDGQHVQGTWNIEDAESMNIHIVGNGMDDDNRSNAHTLDWDGNAWFAGDVYVDSTSGTNKDAGSKKLATEEYVTNILSNAGGAFYAAYGTTTNAEIKAAYDAGKTVLCAYDTRVYRLYTIPTGSNTIYFTSEYDYDGENDRIRYVSVSTANAWSNTYGTDSSFSNAKYYNGSTEVVSTTGYYRPIRVSTAEPTASDGNVGDIWIQYSL